MEIKNAIFALLLSIIGIIISMILDNYIDRVSNNSSLFKVGILSMIAIILHNIPEGIVTFIVSNKDIKSKVIDYSKETLLVNDTKLKGEHNKKNIKAVTSILKILGFDIDVFTIKNYLPLKYHLEESEVNGRLIVNDSKSTLKLASLEISSVSSIGNPKVS